MVDYSIIVELIADIIRNALPIGILFLLVEKLVTMFIKFVFGRGFNV